MSINEIELLADVEYEYETEENSDYGAWHWWSSLLSESTFHTKTTDIAEVIKSRNETDYKFHISDLQGNVNRNANKLNQERLNRLQNRLDVMIRQKGCLCKSDCFCNFEGSCKDCPNVNFSLDEEHISLA